MHQSLDHPSSRDAEATLRHTLRRALARDLNLPEHHVAVTATLSAFAEVECVHRRKKPLTRSTTTTLDTWWCIVAHTHALVGR